MYDILAINAPPWGGPTVEGRVRSFVEEYGRAASLWQLGYPDQARRIALEAVQLAKEIDHPFSQVHGITECGWVH